MSEASKFIAEETKADDGIFVAFDSYPWTEDPRFAALVKSMASRGMPMSTAPGVLVARMGFATKFLGLAVDRIRYSAWVQSIGLEHETVDDRLAQLFASSADQEGETQSVGDHSEVMATTTAADALDWQAAAPKMELVVDKSKMGAGEQGTGNGQPPASFADLLKCMQEGTPVPGVRSIPSTVERDVNIKPFGARAVPRKPWEKDDAAQAAADPGVGSSSIDQEFPPLKAEDSE
ncbi:hypothetical protein BROUX41_000334 [Berkeleyomyces rouxiae]|uniref:uncharacterized protein n=1 Tax=Berkeleyomyces rouxiae TaxID=2035830 RepID=UPI003B792DC1